MEGKQELIDMVKGDAVSFDLNQMTVQELAQLIEAAGVKRQEKLEAAKLALIAEFRERAAEMGLSFEAALAGQRQSQGRKSGRGSGPKVAAKYRGPKGEEWSGRGRLPQWVTEVEKQGRSRDEFLIQKELG